MLKKARSRGLTARAKTEEKVALIEELRLRYKLANLFKISGVSKTNYYRTLNKDDKDLKNAEIIEKIKDIQTKHKGRYGYRRITLELRNRGFLVNHKKVIRLTRKLDLQAKRKIKRKYSSYKGEIGKVADNIIKRDFHASKPNEKWYTDNTEFNIKGEKAYLSGLLPVK